MKDERKVIVYDAIMGSGKTYDAIERMKNYLEKSVKFIYITPFLKEIERVKNELPENSVFIPLSPKDNNGGVYEVQMNLINENGKINLNAEKNYKYLNKRAQFLKFASKKKNIIASHYLFMDLKKEDFSLFKDYILILDEVVDPLNIENIGMIDIEILKEQNLIIIDDDTKEVRFINEDYNDPAFRKVKQLCNNSTVYYLDRYFFVWIFPVEIFKEFKEIQILTYLFEGSLLSAYFKFSNINYTIKNSIYNGTLAEIKELLNIYMGTANQEKKSLNSFSKTWSENVNKKTAKSISDSTSNIFKRKFKTKSKFNGFTAFKKSQSKFSGNSYARGFIPVNSRSTNDFRNIKSMAYLANRYFKPQHINFFRERGIELNEDLWALGELVQWIWRGCIREKKEMNLFIPSFRMRNLLIRWLDGELVKN